MHSCIGNVKLTVIHSQLADMDDQVPPIQRPCGICANPAADIRSHIIPRCEQRRLMARDDKFVVIDNDAPRLVSEHGNRYWQRSLLCQVCESRCADLDSFWATFSDNRGNLIARGKARMPWVVPNVEVALLMDFLISVLLRAHASDIRDFAEFTLGAAHGSAVSASLNRAAHTSGFRLIAQMPRMDGTSEQFRAMPHVSPGRSGAVLWFGVFRFIVGFPGVAWSQALMRQASLPSMSQLRVVPTSLDCMPEYQHLMKTLRQHKPRISPRRFR